MDRISLIILLMSLLNSYHCKPLRRRKESVTSLPSAVRFSLNGHHFQIGLLTMPKIETLPNAVTEKCEKPAIENDQKTEPETQTFTQFAVLNISPKMSTRAEAKTVTPGKINDSTWNKVKSLYQNLGEMLQAHEKELASLMKNQDNSRSTLGVNASSGDTSVRVKINDQGSRDDAPKNDNIQPADNGPNTGDPNSLNIHVHAEPPLKMRTIIGYPKSNRNLDSLKKMLRLYNRETSYPVTEQDSSLELNNQSLSQPDESDEEATFLRRGSELLLNMWRRFKAQKVKNKSRQFAPQNFHEDVDDTKLTNRYFSYPNE